MPQEPVSALLEKHLHVARMATYMAAADGDPDQALRLYLWNLRLSAALFETLSVTEVVFRNAVDAALRTWNPSRGRDFTYEWTARAAAPLNSLLKKPLAEARRNAAKARAHREPGHPRKTAPITHDDLVAQLTFGVYVRLLPSLDPRDTSDAVARTALWTEALQAAFPGRPREGLQHVVGRATRLHALRNRIAHAEPLLSVNAVSRVRDMVRLVDSINPQISGWVASTSRVSRVIAERPG